MDKPEATASTKPAPLTLSELQNLFEGLADSMGAIESRQENIENEVIEIKDNTERIIEKLDDLTFSQTYPGLGNEE